MRSSYYSSSISNFKKDSPQLILGSLSENHNHSLEDLQKNAWIKQIEILKELFTKLDSGHIFFEYSIPRMGKRVDCVLLLRGLVFVLEFKVGEQSYPADAIDQTLDYSIDLKNFHKQSHDKCIIPILVSTEAKDFTNTHSEDSDRIYNIQKANKYNLYDIISDILNKKSYLNKNIDYLEWSNSIYEPTPTIIEAAQALYQGHDVKEISRSDSGALNLSQTSDAIFSIIKKSEKKKQKSICFITGVPGSGKTLAGLNIANQRHNPENNEHTVFLSGNQPLVDVLQESLARDEVKIEGKSKKEALRKTKVFIQNIHHFRDEYIPEDRTPIENVVIFDEAQRAWTKKQTSNFMTRKKGLDGFEMSEPDFLISVMDRHKEWATIVCLVGGGQEINTGEAGLPEWFEALGSKYDNWKVYVSDEVTDDEYTRKEDIISKIANDNLFIEKSLHLSMSVRSFRSELIAKFVKSILDCDFENSKMLYNEFKDKYPIVITRDVNRAKDWLRLKSRGSERFGIISSSGAKRLKPEGLFANTGARGAMKPSNWFLNDKHDVRSSYYLEDVASEFDIQGLELDWTCVAWDANLRFLNGEWEYFNFKGTKWLNTKDEDRKMYLKNSYRVLLTRARQGMIIFIPRGSDKDHTRPADYYNGVYNLLTTIGLESV